MHDYSAVVKLAGIITALREPWDHHGEHVAKYAQRLAEAMDLPREQVRLIVIGAHLHDIGKLAVREDLLNLPRKLVPEETAQMQQHTVIGWVIAESAEFDFSVQQIIRHHHEKWDGTGYPDGLKGDAIPVGAQVVSIADTYSALVSKRPYRDAFSHAFAQSYMTQGKDSYFNPELIDLFFAKVAI